MADATPGVIPTVVITTVVDAPSSVAINARGGGNWGGVWGDTFQTSVAISKPVAVTPTVQLASGSPDSRLTTNTSTSFTNPIAQTPSVTQTVPIVIPDATGLGGLTSLGTSLSDLLRGQANSLQGGAKGLDWSFQGQGQPAAPAAGSVLGGLGMTELMLIAGAALYFFWPGK